MCFLCSKSSSVSPLLLRVKVKVLKMACKPFSGVSGPSPILPHLPLLSSWSPCFSHTGLLSVPSAWQACPSLMASAPQPGALFQQISSGLIPFPPSCQWSNGSISRGPPWPPYLIQQPPPLPSPTHPDPSNPIYCATFFCFFHSNYYLLTQYIIYLIYYAYGLLPSTRN